MTPINFWNCETCHYCLAGGACGEIHPESGRWNKANRRNSWNWHRERNWDFWNFQRWRYQPQCPRRRQNCLRFQAGKDLGTRHWFLCFRKSFSKFLFHLPTVPLRLFSNLTEIFVPQLPCELCLPPTLIQWKRRVKEVLRFLQTYGKIKEDFVLCTYAKEKETQL